METPEQVRAQMAKRLDEINVERKKEKEAIVQ